MISQEAAFNFAGGCVAAGVGLYIYNQTSQRRKWRTEDQAEAVAKELEDLRREHAETALRVAAHDTRLTVLASEQTGIRASLDALTRVVEKVSDQLMNLFRGEK